LGGKTCEDNKRGNSINTSRLLVFLVNQKKKEIAASNPSIIPCILSFLLFLAAAVSGNWNIKL
jgi:hypothetical protein